jgi:predicted ATPase
MFPVSVWLREFLAEGIQRLVLNSQLMKKPSPPGQGRRFKPDGSNLPWVIEDLRASAPDTFQSWLSHIRTALPEIVDVQTVEIPDDKYRYVVIEYSGGFSVPSWLISDGTLRLLALTLPAYLPTFSGTYLVEEPENGIHPQAVETVFQSLSSVYGAQILVATHSPVFLSLTSREHLLCFSKTASGSVDIVNGDEHPFLKDWKGEQNLSVFFAVGLLS